MNFDPMTGQPINQNYISTNNVNMSSQVPSQTQTETPIIYQNGMQDVQTISNANQNISDHNVDVQRQLQNIPNVEQSREEFISNTQVNNNSRNDNKKTKPDIIFFLFPYLLKFFQ